jgi:hypothetical protein
VSLLVLNIRHQLPQDIDTKFFVPAHPTGHHSGSLSDAWRSEHESAWHPWTGQPTHSHSVGISITEEGTPSSTSTIHLTETVHVSQRNDEHKSPLSHPTDAGKWSSWTHETGISKPTHSRSVHNSWTKSSRHGEGMSKRGNNVSTRSHPHPEPLPTHTTSRSTIHPLPGIGRTTGHRSSHRKSREHPTSTSLVSALQTTMLTMPSYSKGM